MRDASEVIAEMRAMATGAHFVEAGLVIEWADELAAAEPADAGRDAVVDENLMEAMRWLDAMGAIAGGAGSEHARVILRRLARPPSEAAAVDDAMVDAFVVAEQRVYNEIHDMAPPDLYRLAVRKGIEAALASQQAVKP